MRLVRSRVSAPLSDQLVDRTGARRQVLAHDSLRSADRGAARNETHIRILRGAHEDYFVTFAQLELCPNLGGEDQPAAAVEACGAWAHLEKVYRKWDSTVTMQQGPATSHAYRIRALLLFSLAVMRGKEGRRRPPR